MASRRHSPLVGQTWHHASTPTPIVTAPPSAQGFSPLPCNDGSLMPAGDGSWSGDWKQLFANSNSSDWPSQSAASSASWSDELENDSSKKLGEQYELLESALYGDSSGELLSNPNLAIECKQWKERFPHLRALGSSIKGTVSTEYQTSETESFDIEEVIAVHGQYEDPNTERAVSPVNNIVQVQTVVAANGITEEDVELFKEKIKKAVLDQIFARIWPNVIKRIDPVFKKLAERKTLSLKPGNPVCIENNPLVLNCNLEYTNADTFLRISPLPSRESSAKRAILCPPSTPTVQIIKSNTLDCSVPQVGNKVVPLNVRNSSAISRSSSCSVVKLAPPVVFPSAEKLLSPIPPESRNVLQSARFRKKLSLKNNCPSAKSKRSQQPQPQGQVHEEGRFCAKEEKRPSVQFDVKKSPRGNWNRHGTLPPISSKENIKTTSAATQRSTSALMKLGKTDLETRPNTSLPNKSGMTLLPLSNGIKKKSRLELAQEWLEKQLSPSSNNSKHHLSTYVDTSSKWRSHHFGYRK